MGVKLTYGAHFGDHILQLILSETGSIYGNSLETIADADDVLAYIGLHLI